MKQILNTLSVMTQGAYVSLDHETLKVEVAGKSVLQVPLHHLGGVVTFGNVMMSPFLLGQGLLERGDVTYSFHPLKPRRDSSVKPKG